MTQSYLALDLEMVWDEELFEQHRSFDRKSNRHAVAVKTVMAAAVYEFSIGAGGQVSSGPVASWNEHTWGDEQAVLSQLFDHLNANAHLPVLTYGGLGTDIPVLVLASMAHGLPLPKQLRDQPGRKGPRSHLDLGIMLKSGGKTWSHLSQVLLRAHVPLELVKAKPHVQQPKNEAEWQELTDHCELDCLLLSIAKLRWLKAQGTDALNVTAASVGLIAGFLRKRPDHSKAAELRAWMLNMEEAIAMTYQDAA